MICEFISPTPTAVPVPPLAMAAAILGSELTVSPVSQGGDRAALSVQCARPPAAVDFAVAETDECIEGGGGCRGCIERDRGEQDKHKAQQNTRHVMLRLLSHAPENWLSGFLVSICYSRE
jgi:hypothetical protein